MSPRASAPASNGGRNGRTPLAPASPAPWPMSRKRLMVAAFRRRTGPGRLSGAMTIDDHPRGTGRGGVEGGEWSRMSRPASTTRDLERYAGLFASRTREMKSSAMRDMMAITARPEVISLAGGFPETGSFPAESFAAAAQRIAAESCARALQYGPTDGLDETKTCIAEVMAAQDMRVDPADMIVTTGGQQVIALVTKTLIDPGDVIVAEGPTYPGAVPTFSSYQADVVHIDVDSEGMQVELLEEVLDRLDREGRT